MANRARYHHLSPDQLRRLTRQVEGGMRQIDKVRLARKYGLTWREFHEALSRYQSDYFAKPHHMSRIRRDMQQALQRDFKVIVALRKDLAKGGPGI